MVNDFSPTTEATLPVPLTDQNAPVNFRYLMLKAVFGAG